MENDLDLVGEATRPDGTLQMRKSPRKLNQTPFPMQEKKERKPTIPSLQPQRKTSRPG
jgi:hypothetical protein